MKVEVNENGKSVDIASTKIEVNIEGYLELVVKTKEQAKYCELDVAEGLTEEEIDKFVTHETDTVVVVTLDDDEWLRLLEGRKPKIEAGRCKTTIVWE